MHMFEKSSRLKLRFDLPSGGICSDEDLWDLPLKTVRKNENSLNNIAKAIFMKKNNTEISFVDEVSAKDSILDLQLNIVKHIIEVKKQEALEQELKFDKEQKKKKLLNIIASKEEDEFKSLPLEELKKMYENIS